RRRRPRDRPAGRAADRAHRHPARPGTPARPHARPVRLKPPRRPLALRAPETGDMPHIIIEYSANLRDEIAIDTLVERLHRTAIDTGVFPIGGARTRAAERSHYRIA